MITNIGVLDAAARLVGGVLLLAWCDGRFGHHLHGTTEWIVWIIGVALTATALLRYCPLYALAGTDSCATDMDRDGK